MKVCGMREAHNIDELCGTQIDWIGFILYPKSPRYIGDSPAPATRAGVKRVGVFVNATMEQIRGAVERHRLDIVQLHGQESCEMCSSLRCDGVMVVKAISVACEDDIELAHNYAPYVDYLLFDTKCRGYGGSGEVFDWTLLGCYRGATPFLLSGGITAEMSSLVLSISQGMPLMAGIDLNSRFEISPGVKDVQLLDSFIKEIV